MKLLEDVSIGLIGIDMHRVCREVVLEILEVMAHFFSMCNLNEQMN